MIINKKKILGLEVVKYRGIPLYAAQMRETYKDSNGRTQVAIMSVFPLQNWMYEKGIVDPRPLIDRHNTNPGSIGMWGFWGSDDRLHDPDKWYGVSWKKVPDAWKEVLKPEMQRMVSIEIPF